MGHDLPPSRCSNGGRRIRSPRRRLELLTSLFNHRTLEKGLVLAFVSLSHSRIVINPTKVALICTDINHACHKHDVWQILANKCVRCICTTLNCIIVQSWLACCSRNGNAIISIRPRPKDNILARLTTSCNVTAINSKV